MDFSLLLRRTRTQHRDAPVPFQSVTSIRVGIFLLAKRAFFWLFQSKTLPALKAAGRVLASKWKWTQGYVVRMRRVVFHIYKIYTMLLQ